MRTTIDIPDDLLRRAKIRAAERGIKLKDVFAAGLEKELAPAPSITKGRPGPLPVRVEGADWTFPHRTNAELMAAVEREDEG